MKKKLSILGSTGSIGLNALKIISHLKDQFEVKYLSSNTNYELLIEQIAQGSRLCTTVDCQGLERCL